MGVQVNCLLDMFVYISTVPVIIGICFQGVTIQQVVDIPVIETRIEDGKLLYEKRWYHRGQSVFVEGNTLIFFISNLNLYSQ